MSGATGVPNSTDSSMLTKSEQPQISAGTMWAYSIANLGCGTFYAFNNYILPLYLKNFTGNAVILGLMGSTHSIEGAVIQPLVGSASDRLNSRFGRRRPFLLIFFLLSALLLWLTPAAAALPQGLRLVSIITLIFLFTVAFNVGWDPYQALMPDITPESQRGRISGIWQLVGNLGQALLLLVPLFAAAVHLAPGLLILRQFQLVGFLMIATTLLTCVLVREPPHPSMPVARRHLLAEARIALNGLRTLRQAARGMAVFALSGAGVGAVLPNLTLFVEKITGCTDAQAQQMVFLLLSSTVLGVVPFGYLTDRIGAKRVIYIGFLFIGGAALAAMWIHTLESVAIVLFLAGIGNAAQVSASYPLLTQLVPGEDIGFYTGFQSTMLSIAQPVTVVVTGILINRGHGNYRIIFLVCGLAMLASLLLLRGVETHRAPDEIARRNAEEGRVPAPAQSEP